MTRQQIRIFLGKIIAHNGDDADLGEIARGQGDIGGRTSQHPVDFAMRRFHAVIGDRPHNDQRHFPIVADESLQRR